MFLSQAMSVRGSQLGRERHPDPRQGLGLWWGRKPRSLGRGAEELERVLAEPGGPEAQTELPSPSGLPEISWKLIQLQESGQEPLST